MIKNNIEILIQKYISGDINNEESAILIDWINISEENKIVFHEYIEIDFYIKNKYNHIDIDDSRNRFFDEIDKKHLKKTAFKIVSVAASIILLLGVLFNEYDVFKKKNTVIVEVVKNDNFHKAILTLSDGKQISIGNGKTHSSLDFISDGKKLTYSQATGVYNKFEEATYNYIRVPKGSEFTVVLNDGTNMFINSDSKLKYPTRFIDGKSRELELIYGEAYFEVSPSVEHNGAKFNVYTKGQTVAVLGTEFNIKAYNDDDIISTTLVGGKITIEKGEVKRVMKPNQQAIINDDSNNIKIKDVDVLSAISWRKGIYKFDNESLNNIMKVISRWYDIGIIFEKTELKQYSLTGILDRHNSISSTLSLIKEASEGDITINLNEKTVMIK